jgi:hypothetical protein
MGAHLALLRETDVNRYARRLVLEEKHQITHGKALCPCHSRNYPLRRRDLNKPPDVVDACGNGGVDVDGRPGEASGDNRDPTDDCCRLLRGFEKVGDRMERAGKRRSGL